MNAELPYLKDIAASLKKMGGVSGSTKGSTTKITSSSMSVTGNVNTSDIIDGLNAGLLTTTTDGQTIVTESAILALKDRIVAELHDAFFTTVVEGEGSSAEEVQKSIFSLMRDEIAEFKELHLREILRHLSLQTVNGDELVLLCDISMASTGEMTAGGIGSSGGGGGGASSLDELSDVAITSPYHGDILHYHFNSSTNVGTWVNVTPVLNLASDVTISSPQQYQFLRYNGTNWVNGLIYLEDMENVSDTEASDGQALIYDYANHIWKPGSIAGGVTVDNKNAEIGTSLTTIAEIDSTEIKARITHQSLGLVASNSASGTSNATASTANSDTYLCLLGGGANKAHIKVTGTQNVSVSAKNGVLTITGPILSGYLSSHQALGLVVAKSSGNANVTTDNSNTYINITGDSVWKSGIKITGQTNVAVSASGGIITITGPNLSSFLTSHQSLGLVVAKQTGTSNDTTGNDNTYVNLLGGGEKKAGIRITGSQDVTVAGSGGVITITGPDLSSYISESDLTDYALKSWVEGNQYTTLTAVEAYLSDEGYLTSAVANSTFAHAITVATGHLYLKDNQSTPVTLSDITGANIVTAISTNAVARASADANGNAFPLSYLRKDQDDVMSGNLTIGSTTASKKLTIYGSTTAALTIYGGSSYLTNIYRNSSALQIASDTEITGTLKVNGSQANGGVIVGANTTTDTARTTTLYGRNNTTTPALIIHGVTGNNASNSTKIYRDANYLQFDSSLYITGDILNTGEASAGQASDRRLKKDIRDISLDEAENILGKLRPVEFEWNDKAAELTHGRKTGVSRGFIADEYLGVLPEAGRKIWGEYDAIYYEQTIPYLVAGWQQQNLRIRILEAEIKTMKEDIEILMRRLREYGQQ